ncbi:MAG TPA: hypothetical protein VGK33_12540, partial [Chloroflexota bacterium]
AIRGPQLEPVVDLFVLIGAVLVFEVGGVTTRRRLIIGGLVLGLAVAIKLSAAIPVAVILVVCAGAVRGRAVALVATVVGGFAVVTLPFVALAPASFWQDTVLTQLGRVPAGDRATLVTRLGEMTGLSEVGASPAVVIAVSAFLMTGVATVFVASRRRPTLLEWFALGATVAVALAQLAPAQYYTQYAALLAPFVALVLGLAAARLLEVVTRPRAALVAAVIASGVLLAAQVAFVSTESAPDLAAVVDAAVPAGACALSDRPVLLFTADRFQSTLAGCTQLTDPAGTVLALGGETRQSVDTWQQAFEHVDYVVTDRSIRRWQLPAAARIPDYVAAHFRLVHVDALLVYVRST